MRKWLAVGILFIIFIALVIIFFALTFSGEIWKI